mmetsp:Transcript_33597/g.72620  ORF Transcript_33597/g.72620 Transcript_33597/m.72620 type:complete len:407 (-) Transcript_33597:384-1604(-)
MHVLIAKPTRATRASALGARSAGSLRGPVASRLRNPVAPRGIPRRRDAVETAGLGLEGPAKCRAAPSPSWSLPQRGGARPEVAVRASSSSAGDESSSGGASNTLLLGGMFGLWYLFNIFFNIYNKQVLKVFAFPITCTALQFIVGSFLALILWTTGLHKKPKVTKDQLVSILPLACVHTLGNLLTMVSLGKVAVSFTHTIKAMEPFFSVALSSIFLGESSPLPVLLTLVPIVGGVALASATEASFNWAGFGAAMGSNLTFQSRNVLSKKFMTGSKGEKLDNINLFSVITMMSAVLLLPVALFTEGFQFAPAKITAMGLDPKFILSRALFAGICFHSYQQVSYMILQRVSPVTHSIGNCVKRVVVITSSVIFFATPVSLLNGIGTAMALSGVFAYSQVKRLAGKKKD